jgi:hypothetical protein
MAATTLERAVDALPRDLQHVVWAYIDHGYPCDMCRALVPWSTIVEWGQGKDPETYAQGADVWCSDACLMMMAACLGWRPSYSLYSERCTPCVFRKTWSDADDNSFYPWLQLPCTHPYKCRGHKPCRPSTA